METPWGTTQQFNLHDSINTNFLDEDIQPISGRQRPLIFDGIDARDGLTNYRSTQEVNSSNIYTYYTQSGKKISLQQDGANNLTLSAAWRYNVLVDGVNVGKIGQRSVISRLQVPGDNYDVAVTATGTLIALGRDGILREYSQSMVLLNSKNSHIITDILAPDVCFAIICRGPATTYASYVICYGLQSTRNARATDGTSNVSMFVAATVGVLTSLQNSWAWRNSNSVNTNLIGWCPNSTQESFRYGSLAAGAWTAITQGNFGVPAYLFTAGPSTWTHWISNPSTAVVEWGRSVALSDAALVSNVAIAPTGPGAAITQKQVAPGAGSMVWTQSTPSVRSGYLRDVGGNVSEQQWANGSLPYTPDSLTARFTDTVIESKMILTAMTNGKIVSYHMADYDSFGTTVNTGQAIINYGDTVSDYAPSIAEFSTSPNFRLANNYYQVFVHKQSDGQFCMTILGNANPANLPVSQFIREIVPDVVAFECDTGYGIFDCNAKRWYLKSQHWGMIFMYGNDATAQRQIQFQYRNNFSETLDIGARASQANSFASAAQSLDRNIRCAWDIRGTDIFATTAASSALIYQVTVTDFNAGAIVATSDLQKGTEPLDSSYTPLAIRQRQNSISALWFDETQLTIPGSDGFFSENIITGRFQVFNINGQTYLYDGSGVSQVFFNGLLFSGKQVVNNAKNLRLLTVSREIAFFFSDFNQSLFGFDGARSMQYIDGFLAFSTIREAWYTSNDDTLWLTDGAKLITWREGKWGAVTYANASGSLMMDTTAGSYIVKEDGQTVNTWSLLTGTIIPMTLKTPFVGLGDNNRIKVRMYSIYLKFDTIANTNITITYRYLLENGLNSSPAVVFNVLSTMMDANGYVRLWYEVPFDTTIGASLEITCASKYWIVELIPYFGVEAVSIPVGAQIIS